jgi:small subunit ribosomal protein S19e
MQALQELKVIELDEEKGGRRITKTGQRDLDRIAMAILQEEEEEEEEDDE